MHLLKSTCRAPGSRSASRRGGLLLSGLLALGLFAATCVVLRALPSDGLGLAPRTAWAQEADEEAEPGIWRLEFEVEKIRMVTPRNGLGTGKTYWYMVYTVENRTAEPVDYFVSITGHDDRKTRYADIYLPAVEEAVEKQERESLFGKADKYKVQKDKDPEDDDYSFVQIAAGEKRRCVAIFNQLNPGAKKMTLQVVGLTNDLRITPTDDGNIEIEEPVRIVTVERPGDEYEITNDSFRRLRMVWSTLKTQVDMSIPED